MAGMFANFLLWPAKILSPQWAFAIRHVGALGLAVATLAACFCPATIEAMTPDSTASALKR
jgi:hypothetical protein